MNNSTIGLGHWVNFGLLFLGIALFYFASRIDQLTKEVGRFTNTYEQREKAKLNVQMIDLSGKYCKRGANYNLHTGEFACIR